MKNVMVLLVLSLVAATASAAVHPGYTFQCWQFDTELIEPDFQTKWNPFGDPVADIVDVSGQGVAWNSGGYWEGQGFQVVIGIPNRPEAGPYKEVKIVMVFQGELGDTSIVDPSGAPFSLVSRDIEEQDSSGWYVLRDTWRIEPNPLSETITITLLGDTFQNAAIDRICIDTLCIPEPATLAILGLGAVVLIRTRKSVLHP